MQQLTLTEADLKISEITSSSDFARTISIIAIITAIIAVLIAILLGCLILKPQINCQLCSNGPHGHEPIQDNECDRHAPGPSNVENTIIL